MFDRILIPLDGSSLAECVLSHVAAIAKAFDSQLMFVRVIDPIGISSRPRAVDPFDWQILKVEAESYLKEIASRFHNLGVSVEQEVLEGRAADSIIDFGQRYHADLIMMSSHGQSGISGWNISSVVQKVILRAQSSVMIIHAYRTAAQEIGLLNYERILLPLDGSQRAECVLPVASSLARHHRAKIIIAHIVNQPEMPRRTPPTQEDIELGQRIMDRNRDEMLKYLTDLKGRLQANTEFRLEAGMNVISGLHKIAEDENADLILLSAHGYSGELMRRYGSIVISFIAYASAPLLVIQDLPPDRMESTQAEIAAREQGGR